MLGRKARAVPSVPRSPVESPPPAVEEPPAPPPVLVPRTRRSIEAAKTFATSVRHLPLFSGTAVQLMRSAGSEDVSGRELSRLVAADAALVAHLLRIVNSPFYGFASRIATVPDTLIVMGVNAVRRIVTASILQRPLLTYLHDTGIVRTFWRHELTCAALARHLARARGLDGETAYMAGLMHDVGRLAMLIQFPGQTDVLLPAVAVTDGSTLQAETETFGFDHAQAGGALLALWGLPVAIVDAAETHADVVAPDDPLSAVVWTANQAAHEMALQPDEDDTTLPWMDRIGLDAQQRRRIVDEIRALEAG